MPREGSSPSSPTTSNGITEVPQLIDVLASSLLEIWIKAEV